MMEVSTKGIHIICYYAQEDKTLQHELLMHLSVLRRYGLIATWYDCSIEAEGEDDRTRVEQQLKHDLPHVAEVAIEHEQLRRAQVARLDLGDCPSRR